MSKQRSKFALGMALAVVMSSAIPAEAGPTLDRIRAQGYVRAATANEVPYGYMDTDGKAKGLAPEVAEKVLATMGIPEVQWVVTPFGSLIPGLKARRFDMVAAEQDILPERCKQVSFSEPNTSYGDGLLVRAGNPKKLHAYEDIKKDKSLKLAVVNGTSHLTFAEGVGIPENQLVVIAANADAPATVASGRADAYAAVEATVATLAKGNPNLAVAQPFSDPVVKGKSVRSYGGFAFQPEAADFISDFNKALASFKRTEEYVKILSAHGISEQSIAASLAKSTADLCSGK